MSDALFKQPRRKTGPTESLLSKTLRAWHRDGYLAGDSWASARGVLRLAARNVDDVMNDVRAGDATPLQAQRVVAMYSELMTTYRAAEEVTGGDSIDALLASISAPPVRDV